MDRHAGDALDAGTAVRRRDVLIGMAGAALLARARPRAAAAPLFMYIGSFTQKDGGHGDGLSVYRRGSESEPWQLVEVLKDLADPSFIVIDRQQRSVYTSHGDGTHATAYRIDSATGRSGRALHRWFTQPPCGARGTDYPRVRPP